jgi:hypothetical protein
MAATGLSTSGLALMPRAGYNAFAVVKWQDLLRDSIKNETIKASTLRKIPQLKACPYWDRAIFLGRISHRVQFANYEGGLVKYDGRIYFVNRSQIEALSIYVRWDLRKNIKVLEG